MLPLVALVGRPNVGKSTLFNALTRSRDALVHDEPGVTRDRHYGVCRPEGQRPFAVVDTGGIAGEDEGLAGATARQARGFPAAAATSPYVATRPGGMRLTATSTRRRKSAPSISEHHADAGPGLEPSRIR